MSRANPREDWIVTEVPDLRIVDDALWQAVKNRQEVLREKLATAVKPPHRMGINGLNTTHRPRHLLSGLLECGVCGGPYTMRGQDRYACSNHVTNRICSNGRSVRRNVLEDRVLAGLRDRLLAPTEIATAVRACLEETEGLNYECSESRKSDLDEITDTYRDMVTRLTETLCAIEGGTAAASLIRSLVERVLLVPGPKRGEVDITVRGDLADTLKYTGTTT